MRQVNIEFDHAQVSCWVHDGSHIIIGTFQQRNIAVYRVRTEKSKDGKYASLVKEFPTGE